MRSRRYLVLFLAFLSTLLSAQTWHQGSLGPLRVVSDAGDSATRDALQRLQIEREIVGQILHKNKVSVPTTVQLVMVKDPQSLTKAMPQFPIDAMGRGAADFEGLERVGIVFTAPAQWESAQRIFAQSLLSVNYPKTPRWFDIGFGRYVSSMTETREQVELGRPPIDDKAPEAWIPIMAVLTGGNEGDAQWQHEAWVMVHWLISNSRLDEAGKYFYLTMNQQKAPRDAIFEAFSEDAQTLDNDLRAYEREIANHIQRIPTPALQQSVMFDINKASATDVQTVIASVMLDDHDRSDSAPAAMKVLSGIMHNTPDNVSVQRALAYGYFLQRDSQNAVEHARRAISLVDSDPMMHYIMAVGLNGGDPNTIHMSMADVKLGMELNAALKLNPDFPPAYELRGIALMSADKNDAGMKDLGRATSLRPREDAYLFHLGEAQAQTGDWENARVLFAMVKNSPDTDIASAATAELKTGKRLKKEQKHWQEQGIASSTYHDMTDPRWKPTPEMEAREKADNGEKKVEGPDTRQVKHLDGELVGIDCSGDPGAILTIQSRGSSWKMKVSDRKSVVLIGPDTFSCSWSQKKVSVNYKPSGGVTGDVVSLEVE